MANAQHMNPSTMAQPTGYHMVVKTGNTVYIAGQIAQAQDGSSVGVGDAEAQVRQIWRNIEAAVKAAGGTGIGNVVKTTTYVTDIQHGCQEGPKRALRQHTRAHQHPGGRL